MNRQFRKSVRSEFTVALLIVLSAVAAVLFWKMHIPKEAAAEPAKVVFRSRLGTMGWYPADAGTLNKQIGQLFQKAKIRPINDVIALILPHAGYSYSGQTAVTGLKTIDKKYERVVIIGPSHRLRMEEMLSVPRVTHYETPLGQISLDVEFIDKLLKYPMFQNVPQAHKHEHSVQIQLPLLQYAQKDFRFVPIVAGNCSLETIAKTGTILRGLVDGETLVVASSDFVHYGPNYNYVPFTENIPEQIKKLDMGAYEHIARMDSKGFLEYKHNTGATICGYVPIAVLLSMLGEDVKAELIKYATSGELTGDFTNSVSYLSVAFSGTWGNYPEIEPADNSSELTDEDKKELLTLARKTINYALQKRRIPQASELGIEINDAMKQPRAAFVTLKKNSQLRGCIGDIFPQRPLYKSVILNAIHASVNDRRFPPLTEDECKDIKIEISALTSPQPIDSPDQIKIGVDGVVLNKNGHSAVYLPQVAPEQGWDLKEMLTNLSLKAGLPPDAWKGIPQTRKNAFGGPKEGASFLVFQAVVFGEEQ